jgi:anti-sigma regulatory factor (Ser/Thr protein kinase)
MAADAEQLVLAVALPNEPASAAKARAAVARSFAGLPDELLEDAQLLVSEAVANAIAHAGAGVDAPIRLSGYLDGTLARIEVADEGPGFDPAVERRGMGSRIFDELATAWGVDRIRQRATTWFELDAAARGVSDR